MVWHSLKVLRISLLASSIIFLGVSLSVRAADDNDAVQKERLPGDVTPSSYVLYFDPKPDSKSFDGEETIHIHVKTATKKIVLNSADIYVSEAEYKSPSWKKAKKLSVRHEAKLEEVIMEQSESIAPGDYNLTLVFQGKLNDKLKGFFREKVTDSEGRISWLLATQMEPIDARRMFPCFDEPAYKASYSITTTMNADESAVSNSPILKEVTDKDTRRKTVTFEPTPKMSTYLVALVIGHIVPSEPIYAAGVPIRV